MVLLDDKNTVVRETKSRTTVKNKQRKNKKSKTYRVDIRMPDGRRVTKSFSRKYDADKYKNELLVEKVKIEETGVFINNSITFADFYDYWLNTEVKNRKAIKTQKCYQSDCKNYLLPLLGSLKLKYISFSHGRKVENFVLDAGKSHRTVNKVMMVLKTILNEAVRQDYLTRSPLRGFKELTEAPKQLEFWCVKDITKFLNHHKSDALIDFYKVTLNTGLRLGEVCGLCWDRVDFTTGFITINRSMTRDGLRDTTKTHKGRHIPMNANVRAILKKRLEEANSRYVFADADGKMIPYNHITQRHFKKAQREAKVSKVIRFHDLRHTFASHFMMNGGNLYTLQKLLGHTDIKTTMIYAHLDEEFLKQASEVVSFS